MLYLMENEHMTNHKVMVADSSSLSELNDRSVDLIVTSPPYPMIEMWDEVFSMQDNSIAACMISKRNSIGIEIDPEIAELALKTMNIPVSYANRLINNRIEKHLEFIESLSDENKKKCYQNTPHGFKVKTRQETAIELNMLEDIISIDDGYICRYKKYENADTDEQIKLSLT